MKLNRDLVQKILEHSVEHFHGEFLPITADQFNAEAFEFYYHLRLLVKSDAVEMLDFPIDRYSGDEKTSYCLGGMSWYSYTLLGQLQGTKKHNEKYPRETE